MIFCPPLLCDSTFRRAKCPRHPALYCLLSALHSHSCVFTLVENCHHLTFWLQRLHHNTTTYSTTGVSCVRHALFMLFTPDNNSKITILWFMNVSTTKFIDPMKSTNSSIQVFKYSSIEFTNW